MNKFPSTGNGRGSYTSTTLYKGNKIKCGYDYEADLNSYDYEIDVESENKIMYLYNNNLIEQSNSLICFPEKFNKEQFYFFANDILEEYEIIERASAFNLVVAELEIFRSVCRVLYENVEKDFLKKLDNEIFDLLCLKISKDKSYGEKSMSLTVKNEVKL